MERIQARYWIETAFPLQDAAEIMAGEQSTGTFIRVPGALPLPPYDRFGFSPLAIFSPPSTSGEAIHICSGV